MSLCLEGVRGPGDSIPGSQGQHTVNGSSVPPTASPPAFCPTPRPHHAPVPVGPQGGGLWQRWPSPSCDPPGLLRAQLKVAQRDSTELERFQGPRRGPPRAQGMKAQGLEVCRGQSDRGGLQPHTSRETQPTHFFGLPSSPP